MATDYQRLSKVFARLKKKLGIADDELKLVWLPDETHRLAGEVKGDVVYIYETSYRAAVDTLHHELVDWLVCNAVKPYQDVLNQLIRYLNDKAYEEKEKVVEKIRKALAA